MNIDKTRKVVSIILMLLVIGTLVFNAFHIVGHCADSSNSEVYGFPLPYGGGSGYGYKTFPYSDSIGVGAVQFLVNNYSFDTSKGWAIFVYEVASDNSYIDMIVARPTISSSAPQPFITQVTSQTFNTSDCKVRLHFQNRHRVRYTSSTSSYQRVSYTSSSTTEYIILNNYLVSGPDLNLYLPKDTYVLFYPLLFSNTDSEYFNDFEVFRFGSGGSSGGGGHSKGGTITEYSFDQTDEPAPSDPSAVAGSGGWLSKILGGLNKLNKTVGDGFLNLVGNLQSFFNPIFGAFEQQIDNFKSSIESKLDDIIVSLGGNLSSNDTSLSDTFLTSFQGSKVYGVVSVYSQGRDLVQGLFNSVETPDTLRFEFDLPTMNLGGHSQGGSSNPSYITKPYGNKLIMDFGWYEDVRNIVVPFIVSWLYVGMLIWLLRAIPGFISGSPSFNTRSVSDGSPVVNSHNEVTPNGFLVRKVGGK